MIVIALCAWHIARAVNDALTSLDCTVTGHRNIDYGSVRQYGADTRFLDTSWVQLEIQSLEEKLTHDALNDCPPDSTDQYKTERIAQKCKTKMHRCINPHNVLIIIARIKEDINYHPLLEHNPTEDSDQREINPRNEWTRQITKMNELCRELHEPFVWEYLFKQWYNWTCWCQWARASLGFLPVLTTNAPVESLWSAVKGTTLAHRRNRDVYDLGRAIMGDYIPNRLRTINAHRGARQPPAWYTNGFVGDWRHKCQTIINANKHHDNPEEIFSDQQRKYKTSLEHWWCSCVSYKGSPYHLCKHLIRFYVESQNRGPSTSANHYQPISFDRLLRQTTHPLIFVKGLHDRDRQSALFTLVRDRHGDGADGSLDFQDDGGNGGDGGDWGDGGDGGDGVGGNGGDGGDSGDGGDGYQDEIDPDWREKAEKGARVKEKLIETANVVGGLQEEMLKVAGYDDTHPHLQEVPVDSIVRLFGWFQTKLGLKNSRTPVPTFSKKRKNNVFSGYQ